MISTPTVTIKLSKAEVELIVNSLSYLTSINLPIESDFLKPYVWLLDDLKKINTYVQDGIRNKENETVKEGHDVQIECKECD